MTPDDKSTDTQPSGFGPDEFSVFMPERARRPGPGARHILFAGVAGACALGVGLGLWARPAMSERQAAAAQPADALKAPAPPARKLQIVVDDRPVPIGKPIDVLPAMAGPSPRIAPPKALPWPEPTPIAAPQGLIKAQAVTPPAPPIPVVAPAQAGKPKLPPLMLAALLASKPAAPKAVAPKALAPTPVHLAKAAPAPKVLAASKPTAAHRLELARAATAKAAAHKLELAQAAKAARQQQIQLAKAEARGRAEARAEAKAQAVAFAHDDARKRARLAALAHAVQRLLPHRARPEPVEVAKLDRRHAHNSRHEPQVERASLRTHRAPHLAPAPVRARTVQVPPPSRASGLMKVSAPRCANRDPGQALVCADPSLGAADRQLSRAYQDARNAGVPDAQLQHQQARWLAARSAAAREAPWAVHDVYLARIAELNGQAHEARPEGY